MINQFQTIIKKWQTILYFDELLGIQRLITTEWNEAYQDIGFFKPFIDGPTDNLRQFRRGDSQIIWLKFPSLGEIQAMQADEWEYRGESYKWQRF